MTKPLSLVSSFLSYLDGLLQHPFWLFCISSSWGWFWSLPHVQCCKPLSIVLQAHCLPRLIPWIYLSLPLYWAFLVTQSVKNMPVMLDTWNGSLGWDVPLEEGMAAHSSILAWRIPRTEEPGGLQSLGLQRVRHDWSDLPVYLDDLNRIIFVWATAMTLNLTPEVRICWLFLWVKEENQLSDTIVIISRPCQSERNEDLRIFLFYFPYYCC